MTDPNVMAAPGEAVSMGELQRSLARIEAGQTRMMEDHEQRLRRVERWVYAIPSAVIVSAAAVVVAVIRGGP